MRGKAGVLYASVVSDRQPEVAVTRVAIGPFERIVLVRTTVTGLRAELSVYRVGDTLVDAGSSPVAATLVEALRSSPPRRIVCTHQHEDHVGGVAALRAAFGALPVLVPEPHVALLRGLGPVPPYRADFWGHPAPIDDALGYRPGEVFEAGGVRLEAVATPGHTPGHTALLAERDDAVYALCGDLHTGARPTAAWWESAADDLVASCRRLAGHRGRLRVLPAHGRIRLDGARRLDALGDYVERNADRVVVAAAALGTRDYAVVAAAVFGPDDAMAGYSEGEFSTACFVRSVLDPVRSLPATRVPHPGLPPR